MAKSIHFVPGLVLDPNGVPQRVQIKGCAPQQDYGFTLAELYATVPSLDLAAAYARVRTVMRRVDRILAFELKLRPSFELPDVQDADVPHMLSAFLDVRRSATEALTSVHSLRHAGSVGAPLHLEHCLPFPMRLASKTKLEHTLAFVDANVKVQVEQIAEQLGLPKNAVLGIAESALQVYCLLVKQSDHLLAGSMNFNLSMFLQDRVVNLLFGDVLYFQSAPSHSRGRIANRLALSLLRQFQNSELSELAALALYMGIIWSSRPEIQRRYELHPEQTVAELGDSLMALRNNWAVCHIGRFLSEATEIGGPILVVLDDNGESVFDLAFFQALLAARPNIRVTFLVNRLPVSTNLTLQRLQEVLEDEAFASIQKQFVTGRARISVESQLLSSFEEAYLSAEGRACVGESRLAYVKGANFFETFQPTALSRYYAFVVSGHTSAALSGFPEGKGVFARVRAGELGYEYRSAEEIVTLRTRVESEAS